MQKSYPNAFLEFKNFKIEIYGAKYFFDKRIKCKNQNLQKKVIFLLVYYDFSSVVMGSIIKLKKKYNINVLFLTDGGIYRKINL